VLWFVAPSAKTQNKPAAAQLIDGVGDLGQQRGIAKARGHDEGSDFDAGGRNRQRTKQRAALPGTLRIPPFVVDKQMIGNPD